MQSEKKLKYSKKQIMIGVAGIIIMLIGIGILSVMGFRKIRRDLHRQKLMQENIVVAIPELHIKAPVLEGTEQEVLREGAGHFIGTGAIGQGNYCIAAHSSAIYKEYFNNLKNVENGMEIFLYRPNDTYETYTVTDSFIVEPNETWVLGDFGDCRVTLVTCTDDGSQRRIVVGTLKNDLDASDLKR